MPPRARRKKTEPVEENTEVTTPVEETDPATVDEGDAPKRRGGRKRSELAAAAREFEKQTALAATLEARYNKLRARLSEVQTELDAAERKRDDARGALDAALAGTVVPSDGGDEVPPAEQPEE